MQFLDRLFRRNYRGQNSAEDLDISVDENDIISGQMPSRSISKHIIELQKYWRGACEWGEYVLQRIPWEIKRKQYN